VRTDDLEQEDLMKVEEGRGGEELDIYEEVMRGI